MATALGIWIRLAGVLPVLVGLAGMRRVRRLREEGVKAWAVAVPGPPRDGERRPALQYTLPDGRVLEKPASGKTAALSPGRSVLIWYDPADPQGVLIYGHQGRASDLAFIIVGAALILGAAVVGILAP
jgi:hypothetical protein